MTEKQTIEPPEPGIYLDVPAEDYFKWPALSRSEIVTFSTVSPAQYKLELTEERKVTDPMRLGSAVDTFVFEGADAFLAQFHRLPPGLKRDKRTQAYKDEVKAAAGKTMMKAADYDKARTIGELAVSHEEIAPLLAVGEPQPCAVWSDPKTGILCKARADFRSLAQGDPIILDMKVSTFWHPDSFGPAMANNMLYWQGTWYTRGFSEAMQFAHDQFTFFAVKPTPVHSVAVHPLSASAMGVGGDEIDAALAYFKQCQDRDEWPANFPSKTADLPYWKYRQFDK